MAATTPRKFTNECVGLCKLRPDIIGEEKAELLLDLKETGVGAPTFHKKASAILGIALASSSVERHFYKHYKVADDQPAPDPREKVPHMEILETIIQRGFQNSKNWKPGIKDTLDAIKEFRAMTGGSAFEDMLKAMSEAAGDDDEEASEATEAVEAVLSPDERPTEDAEELEAPAL